MTRTKIIYFLSAFVLIIGCYALNTSYSLFVQTETINDVSSTVPTLSYSLGENELTTEKIVIKANSEELYKIKINNTGTTNIKYVLSLIEKVEGVNIQLVKLNGNDLIGSLSGQNSKYIWFYITNSNSIDKEIVFNLFGTYYTLNINSEEIIENSNVDFNNLYELDLNENILLNAINASIDNSLENKSLFVDDINIVENNPKGLLLNINDEYTESTGNNSYYFKGNVKDNYINFANMCFRIVRIEGDQSVKLILEDIDNICEESNGNYSIPLNKEINLNVLTEENIDTETIEEQEIIYNGTYGYRINSNEQIILDYLNSSVEYSMIDAFKKFQLSLSEYIPYMKVNSWCLNENLYEDEEGKILVSDVNNNYEKWIKMYYVPYNNIKNNEISLICNGNKVSKFNDSTDIYVSTLSSNEVILAGINENNENTNNYLMNSYSSYNVENEYNGINYWTNSPAYFDGLRSYAYTVNSKGMLVPTDLLNESITFRPTIIINNTKVISGDGTKNNPYSIETNKVS